MHETLPDSAALTEQRAAALRTAGKSIALARYFHGGVRMHRGMARLAARPRLLLEALLLPALFCALAWGAKPVLLNFWRGVIEFWMDRLGLPIQAVMASAPDAALHFRWLYAETVSLPPSGDVRIALGLMIAALLAVSLRLPDRQLPLAYLIRVACGLQLSALVYFQVIPTQFPYTVTDHLAGIFRMGYWMIMLCPLLLAVGFYVLDIRLRTKLAASGVIMAYFVVMLPHKVIAQALILHYGSLVFMPVLYLCCGTLFDMLVFVALYSWVMSRLPPGIMDQNSKRGAE